MTEREPERGAGNDVEHLRGKDHRAADDYGHGHPRPDEVGSDVPSVDQTDRSRYTGHGRDTEGAFGEENDPVERLYPNTAGGQGV
jgi:hypothetical protein